MSFRILFKDGTQSKTYYFDIYYDFSCSLSLDLDLVLENCDNLFINCDPFELLLISLEGILSINEKSSSISFEKSFTIIENVNVLPFPYSELTYKSPPKKVTILLQTFRPIPMPCSFYLLLLCSFPNILNRFICSFRLMPIPVSITLNRICFLSGSKSTSIVIDPYEVNLRALDIRLMRTCLSLRSSEQIEYGQLADKFFFNLIFFDLH